MKRLPIFFLQIVIVLFVIGVFVALLVEPHFEGRNVGATWFQIYFKDPFLAYVYLGSIPFFVGCFQVFKVLTYIGENNAFSPATLNAVRIIKKCALINAGAVFTAIVFLVAASSFNNEDAAGAVMLGLIVTLISLIAVAVASIFEGILKNGINLFEGKK